MQTCAKRSDEDGLILKLGKERRGIPLFRVLPFDFIVARIPLQIKCGVYEFVLDIVWLPWLRHVCINLLGI